ncbi:UNVERIFIED_CONTAM: hypothetical protein FKN15_037039 [Acipenser sinensis]
MKLNECSPSVVHLCLGITSSPESEDRDIAGQQVPVRNRWWKAAGTEIPRRETTKRAKHSHFDNAESPDWQVAFPLKPLWRRSSNPNQSDSVTSVTAVSELRIIMQSGR